MFPLAGKSSESGHYKDVNESLLPSTSSNVSTAAAVVAAAVTPTVIPSTTGKTLQLPIVASTCKNSDASCSSKLIVSANTTNSCSLLHSCTKRSHHNSNISSAKSTVLNSNLHHQFDANCKSPSQQQQNFVTPSQSTIKIVSTLGSCPFNRADDATESIERTRKMCVTASQVTTTAPKTGCSIKKESLSCDSISKSTYACAERAEPIAAAAGMDGCVASPMSEYQNSSLLSVNSGTSAYGSSGSSCGNNISSTSTVTASNAPMISLSKSETNISEGNRMSVYSVVSLNDLNESDPFLNRPMNDLSKTQCLNQI